MDVKAVDAEIISVLISAGMTEREARVYSILLSKGESQASEIANLSKIPQPHIYSILKSMHSKGLVKIILGRKKKFCAIPLKLAIDKLINEKERALVSLRKEGLEIAQKITDGNLAHEELKTLKQQMEFILAATKTGLDIIDSEFNIRFIDPEWAKVYGDPAGKKCYEYFMGRSQICPSCGIIKALKTKKPVVAEQVLVKENNRPIQVTSIPFQNEKGEWLVAEINVDITHNKRMRGLKKR